MNEQDQYWQIQKSIAKSIANEPSPTIMRLNEAVVEEFGYLPDFDLINFFIETIKQNNRQQNPVKQDPKLLLANNVAMGQDPSVPKFCQLFQNNFDELPSNDILKYFLTTVRSCQKTNNKEKNPDFELALKIARNNDPSFKELCQKIEKKSDKPPSFEIIDFFITHLIKTQKSASN